MAGITKEQSRERYNSIVQLGREGRPMLEVCLRLNISKQVYTNLMYQAYRAGDLADFKPKYELAERKIFPEIVQRMFGHVQYIKVEEQQNGCVLLSSWGVGKSKSADVSLQADTSALEKNPLPRNEASIVINRVSKAVSNDNRSY